MTEPLSQSKLLRYAFVLIPRFNMMTATTMIEPLRIANYLSSSPLYQWEFLSFDTDRVSSSNQLFIDCKLVNAQHHQKYDMIFVLGSWGCEHYQQTELFNWLHRLHYNGDKLCAVEMATYTFARAKILSQRLATTHWSMLAGFAEIFPNVSLCERLYTIDRNLITCAGGTAGIDLMLYLINQQHGENLSAEITDQMIHHSARTADTAQRRTHGGTRSHIHPYVNEAIKLIEENRVEPIPIPEIAAKIGLSQRQLERYFKEYLGCSIVQLSQLMRLQYARVLLTSTNMPIREVSAASGFNSMSHFSSVFFKRFGRKPSAYRSAWLDNETTPSWPGTVFSLLEKSEFKRR